MEASALNIALNVLVVLLFVGLYFEMRKVSHVLGLMIKLVSSMPETMSKQRYNVDARAEVTPVEVAKAALHVARVDTDDAVAAERDAADKLTPDEP